jgi:hypothetical protein
MLENMQGSGPLPKEALTACASLVANAVQRSSAAANQAAAATASLKVLQLGGTAGSAAVTAADAAPTHLQWHAAVAAALIASVQVGLSQSLASA